MLPRLASCAALYLLLSMPLVHESMYARAQGPAQLQTLKTKLDELISAGKYTDAVPVAETIVSVTEAADPLNLDTALEALAELYKKAGRTGDAEPLLKRVIQSRGRILGEHHPDLAGPLESLGENFEAANRQREAADVYSRLLEIRERHLPPESPEIITLLEKLGRYYAELGRPADAESAFQRALSAREKLPQSTELAENHEHLAMLYTNDFGDQWEDAENHLKRAIDIRTGIDPKDPQLATLLESLAELYSQDDRLADAEPLLIRAIDLRATSSALEDQERVVRALRTLADYYISTGRTVDAEGALKRVVELSERPGFSSLIDIRVLIRLANIYLEAGKLDLAEPLYRRAWKLHASDATAEPVSLAAILEEFAGTTEDNDRLVFLKWSLALREDEVVANSPKILPLIEQVAIAQSNVDVENAHSLAEPYFQRAIAIRETVFGPKDLGLANVLEAFAKTYSTDDFSTAEPIYRRALAIREAEGQPADDALASALGDLANLYVGLDRLPDANQLFGRELAVRAKIAGKDSPTLVKPLRRLAAAYIDNDEFELAVPVFERAMALREKQIGGKDPRLADLLDEIGEKYRSKGKADEAIRAFNRAIDIRVSVFRGDKRHVGKSVRKLTEYLTSLGRTKEAEAAGRRSEAASDLHRHVFYIYPPGELEDESAQGIAEYRGYAPGMRFPIGTYPATVNSQVYGFGGMFKGGHQCDEENYNELWWDNYCERRSSTIRASLCANKGIHQGVDIRGGTPTICERTVVKKQPNLVPIVAVYDGILTQVSTGGTLQLKTDNGHIFKYFHADLAPELTEVRAGSRVNAGQVIGYVSDVFSVGGGTTLHLHFEHWMTVDGLGRVPVPLYCDLVLAYERDRGKRHEVIGGGQRCGDSGVTVALPEDIISELKPGMSVKLNGTPLSVSEIKSEEKKVTLLGGSEGFLDGLNSFISDVKQFHIWKEKENLSKFPEPYASSYAIIAAIDDYDRKKDPENRGASGFRALTDMVARAEQLKTELIKTGFPEANIITLYDEKATSTALDDALGEFHEGGRHAGVERLFFYFGGHGGGAAKSGYLVTYDFDKTRPTRKGFMMSRFVSEHFPNIKAKHILVTLDACSSGLAVPGMDALASTPATTDAERFATLATIRAETKENARNMLVASTGEQPARVEAGGIFTRALIEGLEGKADVIKDGVIQFTELRLYVERRVRAWAAELGVSQEPRSFEATREGNGKVLFMLPSRS